MFAQQSLQPKLSRRRYAGVPYALQNNTVNICGSFVTNV